MKTKKRKPRKVYSGWIPARSLRVIPPKTVYDRKKMKAVKEDS